MTDDRLHFVGIGVRSYECDAFDELPKAVDDVNDLGTLLNERGYTAETICDPTAEEVRSRLKHELKANALPPESAVVLLWSGHADSVPEALHLIAKDTERGEAPEVTPQYLAGVLSRSGATDILLLLDTCYSGKAVIDAQQVADSVGIERAESRTWFGVVASAQDLERAKDGLFMNRLLSLLRNGPIEPEWRLRWSAHNKGILGDDLLGALFAEWQEGGQAPKANRSGFSRRAIFPNPRFDRDAPEQVVEHLLLSAAGRAPDEEGNYFTGRKDQLDQLVAWIKAETAGVFVITGPAGSGKSAIAGRLVSLSNPGQRARLLGADSLEHADPGEGSVAAHVHVRRLTVDQVVEEIDRQLVQHGLIEPLSGGGPRNRGELLGGIERIDDAPLIVLDGLDEAGPDAWKIVDDVVSLLARSAQVVVTTRPLPPRAEGDPTLLQALSASQTIDLGDESVSESTRRDLVEYIRKRLEKVSRK